MDFPFQKFSYLTTKPILFPNIVACVRRSKIMILNLFVLMHIYMSIEQWIDLHTLDVNTCEPACIEFNRYLFAQAKLQRTKKKTKKKDGKNEMRYQSFHRFLFYTIFVVDCFKSISVKFNSIQFNYVILNKELIANFFCLIIENTVVKFGFEKGGYWMMRIKLHKSRKYFGR